MRTLLGAKLRGGCLLESWRGRGYRGGLGVCSNRCGVVRSVAVLHHKVSLRSD